MNMGKGMRGLAPGFDSSAPCGKGCLGKAEYRAHQLRRAFGATDCVAVIEGACRGRCGHCDSRLKEKSMAIRDIELSYVYPPIPERSFDWRATRKGWEPGEPYGMGGTPVIALADLLEQELDRELAE